MWFGWLLSENKVSRYFLLPQVYCVTLSIDCCRIASGSDNNVIQVWHAITGEELAGHFEGHTARVCSPLMASR